MTTQTAENTIIEKTRELCQAIVDQPAMTNIRQQIDTFLSDSNARGQYEAVDEQRPGASGKTVEGRATGRR